MSEAFLQWALPIAAVLAFASIVFMPTLVGAAQRVVRTWKRRQ